MSTTFEQFVENDLPRQSFELANEVQVQAAASYLRAQLAQQFAAFEANYAQNNPATADAFVEMLNAAPAAIVQAVKSNSDVKNITTTRLNQLVQNSLKVWYYFEQKMQTEVAKDPNKDVDTASPPTAFFKSMLTNAPNLVMQEQSLIKKLDKLQDAQHNTHANYFGWRKLLWLLSHKEFPGTSFHKLLSNISGHGRALGIYGLSAIEVLTNKNAMLTLPATVQHHVDGFFELLKDHLGLTQKPDETPAVFLERQQKAFGLKLKQGQMVLLAPSPETTEQNGVLTQALCTRIDDSTSQPWLLMASFLKAGLEANRILGFTPVNLAGKATMAQIMVWWGGLGANWQNKSIAPTALGLAEPNLLVRAWVLHQFGPHFFDAKDSLNINKAYLNPAAMLAEANLENNDIKKGGQQPVNLAEWQSSLTDSPTEFGLNPVANTNSMVLKQKNILGRLLFLSSQNMVQLPADILALTKQDPSLDDLTSAQIGHAMGKLAHMALCDPDFTARLQSTLHHMESPLQMPHTSLLQAQAAYNVAYNSAASKANADDDNAGSTLFVVSPDFAQKDELNAHLDKMAAIKEAGIKGAVKAKTAIAAPKLG